MTLIARAYPPAVPNDMIGLPEWARTEYYDVSASSVLTRATPDDRVAMLRAMLADRFKLIAHVETREQPVFDLLLARGDGKLGPGLIPTEVDCVAQLAAARAEADAARAAGAPPPPRPNPGAPAPRCVLRIVNGRMEGDTTMDNLATMLRAFTGRTVVDKTGLTGFYRVATTFDMMAMRRGADAAPAPDAAPSIFTAVREDLGLKLQPSSAGVRSLVIDRIERPTPD